MPHIQGSPGEIHEFVAHVRANEPGALRYEVWQVDANAAFTRI